MLFHEIYGAYYQTVGRILGEAVKGNLNSKKLRAMISENAFEESALNISEGLPGGKWHLMHPDLSTGIEEIPTRPLTLLEKRWLKALLLDPRIQLFSPDLSGLEAIEPLFTPEIFVYYDRYSDGDHYTDPAYIRHFQQILKALQDKNGIWLEFMTGKGEVISTVMTPYYLEYSEKDDRFRLIAASKKRNWIINLSRIRDAAIVENTFRIPLHEREKSKIVFELTDRRNTLQRVLLHFSHLEKETKKLDDLHYRVTLLYDPEDETEMVIRILSFGAAIKVIEPASFIALLQKRIDRQLHLTPFFPGQQHESDVKS